jgi:hypothetical protein
MIRFCSACLGFLLVVTLSCSTRMADWESLFDGASANAWRGFRQSELPAGWQIVDGALTRAAAGGDIITKEQFDNFELELEWKVAPGGNSGVFFHVAEDTMKYVWQTGPEMQVLDNQRHADGKDPKTSAGSNFALHAPTRDVSKPAGEWNRARLVVNGPNVEHWLNGEKIVEYELWSDDWKHRVQASKFKDMPRYGLMRTGHIALQDHGDWVAFRNIRIRRIP